MRIDAQSVAARIAATERPATPDATKAQYQAKVLRQALDAQQEAATKLLELLETKGKVVDIRA